MSWHISPWVYPVWDSLCLLDLTEYFLSHVEQIFNYNLFKIFLMLFLFLFFFWDPYNSNIGASDIVPEVSETVLSSFHCFYFILFFRSYFHHIIFQFTLLFFCFRYLLLIPSRVFLISVIMLFVYVCLFFNSSSSAAAKSLQLCPTLCVPRDGSLPGSPVPFVN